VPNAPQQRPRSNDVGLPAGTLSRRISEVTVDKPLGLVRLSGSELTLTTQLARHVKGLAQSGRRVKSKTKAFLRAAPVEEQDR